MKAKNVSQVLFEEDIIDLDNEDFSSIEEAEESLFIEDSREEEPYFEETFFEDDLVYTEEVVEDWNQETNGVSEDGTPYVDEGAYVDEGPYVDEGSYVDEQFASDDLYIIGEDFETEELSIDDYETGDDFLENKSNWLTKGIVIAGAAIILMAIFTATILLRGTLFPKSQGNEMEASVAEQVEVWEIGSALSQIPLVGEVGLTNAYQHCLALAQEREILAQQEAEAALVEENVFTEVEYVTAIDVTTETISVMKDLKIKFVNKSTKKLIANVPFSLTVTGPDGKKQTWTDDDQDGVIYHKKIAGGEYKLHFDALSEAKYADITFPADKTVKVVEEIAYKKVEVADEVKKASEVNEAKEDTGRGGADSGEGPTLKDTVEYVDSSTGSSEYQEISKDMIADPFAIAKLGHFVRLSQMNDSQEAPSQDNEDSSSGGENNLENGEAVVGNETTEGAPAGNKLEDGVSSNSEILEAVPAEKGIEEDGNKGGENNENTTEERIEEFTVTVSADSVKTYIGSESKLTVTTTKKNAELVASSGDEAIALVSVEDGKLSIQGVGAGSTTIDITAVSDDGRYASTSCAVVVVSDPKDDTMTVLKDKAGNTVYVMEDGGYRVAKYADYYTATSFYISCGTKYTGWQVMDGNTYYYDASGVRVTGDQVIQGMKYSFDASSGALQAGSGIKGIDVSKWNGAIDWNAVANAGIKFAIIRVGYRGSSQGALIDDATFATNMKGATAAGLKVGVYFYTQAIDEVEALYEASMVLDRIAGYRISYPIFLDVESSGGRADAIDVATRTAVCNTFLETIRGSGYSAGIYANKTWFTEKISTGSLKNAVIWLAQYASEVTYGGHYDIWQYSEKGSVSGIKGKVDMNLSYMGY